MKITCLLISIPLRLLSKSVLQKGLKQNLLKRSLLSSSYKNWKILLSPFPNSLMVLCLTFLTGNSYSSLFLNSLLIPIRWLLPVTVLLLLLPQENGNIASVTVPVTATFPSLIATSVGIHPDPVFIMDTIYICWLLLIRKMTFLFSLCSTLPQDMIPMAFCIPFSE